MKIEKNYPNKIIITIIVSFLIEHWGFVVLSKFY